MKIIYGSLLTVCLLLACLPIASMTEMPPLQTPTVSTATSLPIETETTTSNALATVTQRNTVFPNGDMLWIRRYHFLSDSNAPYTAVISIPGTTLETHYRQQDGTFITQAGVTTLPKEVIFLKTETHEMVIGPAAVYQKPTQKGVLTACPNEETPIVITKGAQEFFITFTFPQNSKRIGEVWGVQSAHTLYNTSAATDALFKVNNFVDNMRLSYDGYLYQTLDGYVPGGRNVYFLHPEAYAGGGFVRQCTCPAVSHIAYYIMKRGVENQNQLGFWETAPRSQWLKSDFGIGAGFYDTRFNNGFGISLLGAYKAYGDPAFLESCLRYAAYYVNHINTKSYGTGQGILVSDYSQVSPHKKTHVSLNHHLNGMNFLLQLYSATGDIQYKLLAERMLRGVAETKWLLPSGNLRYAQYYTGSYNKHMVDYPYLTYNDIIIAQQLCASLGIDDTCLQPLQESKLAWMRKFKVTGYIGYES